ncbi:MAG: Rrf2 family transcriptional regulator [Candidatus Zixiibacteriota bacterium]
MKVTALEEYGLRCMLMFAKTPEKSLTIPEISEHEGLSLPYTGKLLMILKKSDLVKAERGRNGGYSLTKPPEEINLKDIFSALGDSLYGAHHCDKYSTQDECCVHAGSCQVGGLWSMFDHYITEVLKNVTLADIAAGKINYRELIST